MGSKCLDVNKFEEFKYTNPGIYLIYTQDKDFFKHFPIYPKIADFLPELKEYKPDKYLLYIGSACKSIASRLGTHISGDVCESTVRRKIAVLMGYKFTVRNQKIHLVYPKEGFQKQKLETKITKFIKANLGFEVLQMPNIRTTDFKIQKYEYDLIRYYNPVLNVGHVNDRYIMEFHKKLTLFGERLYVNNE